MTSGCHDDDREDKDGTAADLDVEPLWQELGVQPPGDEVGGPSVDEMLLRQFHENDPSLDEETRHNVAEYIASLLLIGKSHWLVNFGA